MRKIAALLLPLLFSGCASTGGGGGSVDEAKNLTCLAARVELQRCAAGAETDHDRCLYAQIVVAACGVGDAQTLAASSPSSTPPAPPSIPGSGYTPSSLTSYFRRTPGGQEEHAQGSLSADPWEVNCRGKVGGDLAACLRSRFLTQGPEVCAAFTTAFGVDTCGMPGGGWSRGPGAERFGAAVAALQYFCENDPAYINSPGKAGGYDCLPTAIEWTRLGAFSGEQIVVEWVKRTSTPPTPCAPCPICPPEVRCDSCCPEPLPCPPPFVPQLTARTLGELKMVCSQIPSSKVQQRKRCVEAIKELGSKLGFEVGGGMGVDPLGEHRAGGSIIDPCGDRIAGGSGIDPVGRSGGAGIDPVGSPEVALSAERW